LAGQATPGQTLAQPSLSFGKYPLQPWQDRHPDPRADLLISANLALESCFNAMQSAAEG
jgi:hypothetical protein